jgi:WD40 repeat protein
MKNARLLSVLIFGLLVLSGCGGGSNSGGGGGNGDVPTSSTLLPSINTAAPPNGGLNLPYDFQFTAANGRQPFSWNESGALPAGLNFNAQGELSGTPTATGSFPTTISVQDSLGQSAIPLSVTIQIFPHGYKATGDLGTGRASHTATLLTNGKVLVVGGYDDANNLATAELFDPTTGTFTATSPMAAPRWVHTATLLDHGPAATNGRVLLAGGPRNNTAELFDPATGTFTTTGMMVHAREEHAAALLNNGKVLLVGGGPDNNTAELFDPSTGSFTPTGDLATGRFAPTATVLANGTVLITGGYNADLESFDSAELYDPATGGFTATGHMIETRANHAASLLNNGNVLLTGGFDTNGNVLATAELYDQTTGTFSPVGGMDSTHAFHTATLLDDGTVLVTGGYVPPNPPGAGSSSAELFDSTTNTFTPIGSFVTGRYLHTATRLNNSQVLITGGLFKQNPTMTLNSSELYK